MPTIGHKLIRRVFYLFSLCRNVGADPVQLLEIMQGATRLMHGVRGYTAGRIAGIDAVCVLSRILHATVCTGAA